MDPLHATIEEFAADGLHARRVLLPAMSRDPAGEKFVSVLLITSHPTRGSASTDIPRPSARPA